ncbi:hypothetical protein K2Y11_05790 [bacterium]|nr:hypothetical protein [bacterium]
MDQLKQAGEFVWKWRFWFSLGLVLIFAVVVQPVGTARVKAQVQQRRQELDGALNQIRPFSMGSNHPNPQWQQKIQEKQLEADSQVGKIQEDIYLAQQNLMTWPDVVAEKFKGRPFNTPLDDDQGRFLFLYYRDFDNQVKALRLEGEPLTLNKDGLTTTGKVVIETGALERPTWTQAPDSQQAWLAQEQIWIQRAILQGIVRINQSAKSWYDAPVHQIVGIRLGSSAVDVKKLAETGGEVKLLAPQPILSNNPAAVPPPGGAGQGGASSNTGNVTERYSEMTPESRTVPVQIALIVDQRKLPDILSGLCTIDFAFVVKEVAWNVPSSRISVPPELDGAMDIAKGEARSTINNAVQLLVNGDMVFYEMPMAMRQKWDAEQAAAAAPPGQPGQPGQTVPGQVPPPGQPIPPR